MLDLVLTLQLATTLPLLGLIAFVQWAHYPLLAELDAENFPRYHARYIGRVTPIVAPLMLGELVAASGWVVLAWSTSMRTWALVGLGLVGVVWASTALLQVPCHERLSAGGADRGTIARLVRSNGVRTGAWAARAALVLAVGLPPSGALPPVP